MVIEFVELNFCLEGTKRVKALTVETEVAKLPQTDFSFKCFKKVVRDLNNFFTLIENERKGTKHKVPRAYLEGERKIRIKKFVSKQLQKLLNIKEMFN